MGHIRISATNQNTARPKLKSMMSYVREGDVSELEREYIQQRQKEGIAVVKRSLQRQETYRAFSIF